MPNKKIDICPINEVISTFDNSTSNVDAYHDLVNYAPICIHEIGLDGCLKKMNQAGLDMMGLELEKQVVDEPYTNFVGKNNQNWVNNLLQKAIKGQPIPNFEFSVGEGKEKRSFASNFIPMFNKQKQVVKLMGVTREITAEVQAKEALQKLNMELKDRVEEATKELQSSVDTLKATQSQLVESEKMAALGGLVAGVAHEINTPIGIGIAATSHLSDTTGLFSNKQAIAQVTSENLISYLKEVKEMTSLISSNLSRAGKLILSFKQVAVEQNSHEIRPFKVKQYVNEILQSIKPKFEHKNLIVKLDCDEDLTINSEAGALFQIITNLVNNSLAHGLENMTSGNLDINITRKQNTVHLIYTDSGKGIAKEHIKKIFEPFFTTKRGQGRTGLGLHIVYNLVVHSLKGSIEFNEDYVNGSQFTIKFPVDIHDYRKIT